MAVLLPSDCHFRVGELRALSKRTFILVKVPSNDDVLLLWNTNTGSNQSVQVRIKSSSAVSVVFMVPRDGFGEVVVPNIRSPLPKMNT